MNAGNTETSSNIATILALAFIAMTSTVIMISGIVCFFIIVNAQKEAAAGKQIAIGYQAAEAMAGFIREKFSLMEAAVQLTHSEKERQLTIRALLDLEPAFRQLMLLNTQKETLFRVSRMSRADSEGLDQRLGPEPLSGISANGRDVGPVYLDQMARNPLAILSVPVSTQLGDRLGTLLAEVNLTFIWQLIDKLQVGQTGHAYLVDRRGRLIAFSDHGRVLRGEGLTHLKNISAFIRHTGKMNHSGINTSIGINGDRVLGTFVSLENPDWAVMTEIPVKEAYQQVIRSGTLFIIVLLAMSALAGGVGILLGRRLAAPIVNLTRSAKRVTDGEPDIAFEVNGPNEVRQLSSAFNRMTTQLGVRLYKETQEKQALERKISQNKVTQKALEESESILKATLESTEDGVLVVDQNGYISHYNNRFVQIWSISGECLATRNDNRLINHVLPQIDDAEHFTAEIKRLYQSTHPSKDFLNLKDGRILERLSYPLAPNSPEKGRVWFFRDITERKKAEEMLKKSELRLRDLTANVPGVVVQFRTTRDHVYSNEFLSKKTNEIFGLESNSETILDEFFAHIPDAEKEDYAAAMRTAIDTVSPWNYEGRFIRPDGETIWFSGHAIPHDEGDTIVYYGILLDITRRKKMEYSLRLSQFIFDKAEMAIIILGENGEFLNINEAVCRYLGYSREELLGMSVFDVDTEFTPEMWAEHMADLRSHGVKTVETFNRHKNGNVFPIQVIDNVMTFEEQEFHVAFVQDITKRKQAEKELKENEQLLNNILESMTEGVVVLDSDYRYTLFNRYMEGIVNTSKQELLGKIPWQAFPYLKNTIVEDNYKKAMAGQNIVHNELKFPLPHKKDAWFKDSYTPLRDTEGRIIGVLNVATDITRQKHTEKELRRLRNYLSNIINSMPSMLVAVDPNGNVTQWNNQTEQKTGLSFEEARFQPLDQVFPRLAGEMGRIQTAINERRAISFSKVPCKAAQETRFEDITIFPLVANGVEGAVIRVDDVTEQVRLEEMMIQSEKMLSVGGLAAGMAHEINNPLAGMMQTAEVMISRLVTNLNIPANRKAAESAGTTVDAVGQFMAARGIPRMLSTINASGKRVAAIVDNMLSFARKGDVMFSSHDVGGLLDKTIALACTDYDLKKKYDFRRITIEKEYAAPPVYILCEAAKIQQVLLNVLRNGAQAMQEGGTESPRFILRTRNHVATEMAVIEIEDNGPGMDEATRKRVFEPFFTTKPIGVGTGLGLSVSYFIITENHRGEMSVESTPGLGAKFTIRLPKGQEEL